MASEDPPEPYASELDAGWSRSVPEAVHGARQAALALAGKGEDIEPATLEPRGVGALLDTAMDVLRARFAACLGLSLGVWLPVATVERLLKSFEGLEVTSLAVSLLLQFIAQGLVTAVMVHLVYGHLQGRRVSGWSSLGIAGRRAPAVLLVTFVSQMAIGVGTACCLVPGLILGWRWAVAPAALVLEGIGPIQAMTRSFHLARGSFWRWLAIISIQFMLVLPVTTVVGVLSEPVTYNALLQASGMSAGLFSVLEVGVRALFMGLATSFTAVLLAVLYIDFRVRTEGFDLVMRLERLAAGTPPGRQP